MLLNTLFPCAQLEFPLLWLVTIASWALTACLWEVSVPACLGFLWAAEDYWGLLWPFTFFSSAVPSSLSFSLQVVCLCSFSGPPLSAQFIRVALVLGDPTRHSTPSVASQGSGKGNNHLSWRSGCIQENAVKLPLVCIAARTRQFSLSPKLDYQEHLKVVCSSSVDNDTSDLLDSWPLSLTGHTAFSSTDQFWSWFEEPQRCLVPCTYIMWFFCVLCLVRDIWNLSLLGLTLVGLFDFIHEVVNCSHIKGVVGTFEVTTTIH